MFPHHRSKRTLDSEATWERIDGPLNFIKSTRNEIQRSLKGAKIVLALLGAGGKGLEDRRSTAEELSKKGIFAVVPEDILQAGISPSLLERRILSSEELDLAFVNVESWGSVAEFSEFRHDNDIAPKLRVLVRREYHPLYGSSEGYLTDAYLTHDAVFGHIYMYRDAKWTAKDLVPTAREIVLAISERYKQWKAFG